MEDWFADIGLGDEEPFTEGRPFKKKKKMDPKWAVYKYPNAQNFFDSLQSSHSIEEIHKLLAMGVEFLDLKMVKIETDHPLPAVDSLIAMLNEQLPSKQDSPIPRAIEEIGVANLVRPISMGLATATIDVLLQRSPSHRRRSWWSLW